MVADLAERTEALRGLAPATLATVLADGAAINAMRVTGLGLGANKDKERPAQEAPQKEGRWVSAVRARESRTTTPDLP